MKITDEMIEAAESACAVFHSHEELEDIIAAVAPLIAEAQAKRITELEAALAKREMYLSRWRTAHLHDDTYRAELREDTRKVLGMS